MSAHEKAERAGAAYDVAVGERTMWARIVADALVDGGEEEYLPTYLAAYAHARAAERYALAVYTAQIEPEGRAA